MVVKKRFITLAIFFGLAAFIGSCSDDVEPTFLLKAHVKPFSQGRWVIVSDQYGRVLDYKRVVAEGVVEFKGLPHQKLIYTTFDGAGGSYVLTSIQAIPIGTELTLDTTPYPQSANPPILGNASFAVNDLSFDIPSQEPGYWISSVEFGAKYWIYTLLGMTSVAYQGSTLSFDLPLQSVPADVLGIGYRDGIPVHKWFKGVKPGDALTASFSGFEPTKTIPINKKTAYFGVVGMYGDYINGGVGYSLSRWAHWYYSPSSDKNKIPMLGYLDGFDNYWISASLKSPGHGELEDIMYDSFGPVPASIELPDYTYALKNQSFLDFSFSFSNDYTYQNAFFSVNGKTSSQTNIWWTVNAPAGDKLVRIQIPDEIRSKYPDFRVDQLKLNTLDLVKELNGESYGDIYFTPVNLRSHFQKLTYHFQYD